MSNDNPCNYQTLQGSSQAFRGKAPSNSNDMPVEAGGVIWKVDPTSGAYCMPSEDISTLEDWLNYFEKTILKAYCQQIAEGCQININGNIVSLKKALSSCLGMSDQYNTIGKVLDQEYADATNIPMDLTCPEMVDLFRNCLADSPFFDAPAGILGLDTGADGGVTAGYKYGVLSDRPTRLVVKIPQNNADNKYSSLGMGERKWPTTVTGFLTNSRGSSFSAITGSFTAAAAGWYVFDYDAQNTIYYTKSLGNPNAFVTLNLGLKVVDASANFASSEFRLSQYRRTLWDTTKQPIATTGSMILKMGVGDSITPRVWLSGGHPTGIDLAIGTGSLNQWSVSMLQVQDVRY
jgi:hypothetical protein